MKTVPQTAKKPKTLKLRRIAMNAARLTMIGLLTAAFIVSGCSRDNRLTGPGTETHPGIKMKKSGTSDAELKPDRLTIVAQVLRTAPEGGCFYLETDKGNTYTPVCPKSLTLKEGMRLKAEGYVDENIHFFCGNGPAFVIIDYEIIKKSASTSGDPATGRASDFEPSKDKTGVAASDKPQLMTDAAKPVPIIFTDGDMSAAPSGTAIEGHTRRTASGCLMLTTLKNEVYELHGNEASVLLLQDGSYVRVTGYVSSLPYWTCEEATVFNAESITILKGPIPSDQFGHEIPMESAWTSDEPTTERASDFEPAKDKTRVAASDKSELMTDAAKPVPSIFADDDMSAAPSGTAIEGHARHALGGCLMLTTAKNEVYELHSNEASDLQLQDGSYVRVTGDVSFLPYWTCEEATVFNAESITILKRPIRSGQVGINARVSADEENSQEYVDIEGVMHNFGPEGGCRVFNAADGNDYELIFSPPVYIRSGLRLRVKGVLANVSTFCHSGKPINVTEWNVLNENKF
jgi:hypothetical protein